MSLRRLALVLAFIVGGALFLYGSNYYNAVVGWTGVFLVIADVSAMIILAVRKFVVARTARSRTHTA